MDFHDFPTIYSVLKQNGLTDEPADKFYAGALALLRVKAVQYSSHALAVEHNRTVCEWDWTRLGSPYFKVYPAMIPLLSSVGIDVPVDYLRLPFQAFAVRLPAEDNPLVIDDQYYVRSILVCDGQPLDSQERRIYLWLDVGERAMGNSPVLTYCQLECVPGIQIEAFNVSDRHWGRTSLTGRCSKTRTVRTESGAAVHSTDCSLGEEHPGCSYLTLGTAMSLNGTMDPAPSMLASSTPFQRMAA
jgi:hypothetical protein